MRKIFRLLRVVFLSKFINLICMFYLLVYYNKLVIKKFKLDFRYKNSEKINSVFERGKSVV